MIFTADVMSDAGFIVPKGKLLTSSSPLTDYFKTGARIHFEEYLDHLYLPYYQAKDPTLTREALIQESSIASIEDYLLAAQKNGLVTNEDDDILYHCDIEYLAGRQSADLPHRRPHGEHADPAVRRSHDRILRGLTTHGAERNGGSHKTGKKPSRAGVSGALGRRLRG
jgi:hypothetical protein